MSATINPDIITDGLVLCLDAGNSRSYPGSGNTWYDLSGQNAHCDSVGSPTFINNGSASYWQLSESQRFNSVNISQEYRDLFIISRLENNIGLRMIFSKYDGLDKSFRFNAGTLTYSPPDANDWQYLQTEDSFLNGSFVGTSSPDIYNQWSFIRMYRSNDTFSSSFRYQVSSSFGSNFRAFIGKINYICSYDRKLSNEEVLQNYNALKGRYGLT